MLSVSKRLVVFDGVLMGKIIIIFEEKNTPSMLFSIRVIPICGISLIVIIIKTPLIKICLRSESDVANSKGVSRSKYSEDVARRWG